MAHSTHQEILKLITKVRAAETELEHGYVKLGKHIFDMQAKTLWLILGYASWRDYFGFLQDKFETGRTQLYSYLGTVKSLAPYVDDDTMDEMGITKAKELKRAIDTTNKAPSDELLKKARDPKVTAPQFKKEVETEFHIKEHNEQGTWRDLGGAFFTDEEYAIWLKAINLAKCIDPVIPTSLPKHSQFKESLMRLSEEFIGTYDHKEDETPYIDVDGFNEVFEEADSNSSIELVD